MVKLLLSYADKKYSRQPFGVLVVYNNHHRILKTLGALISLTLISIPTAYASEKPDTSSLTTSTIEAKTSYTVGIKKYSPNVWATQQTKIVGVSTGFSDGNWVNVWIRPAGTKTWTDGGGNWVSAGTFNIPVAYPTPGMWEVQLSMGTYPIGQYSNIVKTKVSPGKPSRPYVVEAGTPDGKRYLKISGWTKFPPGTTVALYVNQPRTPRGTYGTKPVYGGNAIVTEKGSYIFNTPNSATFLTTQGLYKIQIIGMHKSVGQVIYRNFK